MAIEEKNVSENSTSSWQAGGNGFVQSMSRETYIEQILKRKSNGGSVVFKAFSYFITAFGVYALFSSSFIGTVFLLLGAGMIFLSGLLSSVEYEFVFVNEDCEISAIYNKSSRRRLLTFEGGEIERVVPLSNERFKNDLQVRREWNVKKFVSGMPDREELCYGFVIAKPEKKVVLLMELNEKTVEYVKSTYRKKIEKY